VWTKFNVFSTQAGGIAVLLT